MVVKLVSSLGASILMHLEAIARLSESHAKGCSKTLRASSNKKPPLARCKAPPLISVKSVNNAPYCWIRSTLPTKLPCVGWSSMTIGAPASGLFLTITLTLSLENLSSSGCFMRLKRAVRGSSSLFAVGVLFSGKYSSILSKILF